MVVDKHFPADDVADDAQCVVWNGSMGIVTEATIGKVEGRDAWLAPPFDAVGPFDLDAFEMHGRIEFGACIVMTPLRWKQDQVALRTEALEKRREQQARMEQEYARFFGGFDTERIGSDDERTHREVLNLPLEGELEPNQITKAFRKLAQKAHPDTGGSHEAFIKITEARDALLALY